MACLSATNSKVISQNHWGCVLCPSLDGFSSQPDDADFGRNSMTLGFALPLETFQQDDSALLAAANRFANGCGLASGHLDDCR